MTIVKAKIDDHTLELLQEYVARTIKDVERKSHQITEEEAGDAELIVGNLISASLKTNQQKILRALERIETKIGMAK